VPTPGLTCEKPAQRWSWDMGGGLGSLDLVEELKVRLFFPRLNRHCGPHSRGFGEEVKIQLSEVSGCQTFISILELKKDLRLASQCFVEGRTITCPAG